MARLGLLSAVCAVALAAPGVAQAQLVATVADPGVITLTSGGSPVTYLAPGTYTIEVHDLTSSHNFHLSGPGVEQSTGIGETEAPTWTVTFTHGVYRFQCDVHPDSMFGTFAVGNVLSVAKVGNGQGTVTSNPAGIACGGTCLAPFPAGGMVTLTAVASTNSTFDGWSGDCSGTGDCTVTVSGAKSATATFTSTIVPPPPPPPDSGPPASVSKVSVAKKNGIRTVTVVLQFKRAGSVKCQLMRKGRSLVSTNKSFGAGKRTVSLRVPKKTAKGAASVKLTLMDGATHKTFVITKQVKIPR